MRVAHSTARRCSNQPSACFSVSSRSVRQRWNRVVETLVECVEAHVETATAVVGAPRHDAGPRSSRLQNGRYGIYSQRVVPPGLPASGCETSSASATTRIPVSGWRGTGGGDAGAGRRTWEPGGLATAARDGPIASGPPRDVPALGSWPDRGGRAQQRPAHGGSGRGRLLQARTPSWHRRPARPSPGSRISTLDRDTRSKDGRAPFVPSDRGTARHRRCDRAAPAHHPWPKDPATASPSKNPG